mmetsp:Transcript_20969/g.63126  ORF Transcript_20969/g.63126 Transcript_20969/m.63126 type:complete len:388 (+) Transcript_20969:212-1375(+)|eukprot:CAMPEP_0206151432 /NCGR_PEP_ID=MMETSP1473-20131121/38817_1 /ASSEMBLY_ACC=CAM_ASM_001109 /TAXON_ID=1461547 /ORGANISM="Stichococcus sp, Strain RCC1054" /LENGTH=387 /DNA_ID=CAMNT_0053548979 /DNA_START=157 /DNA_END=1320 /DNA_ORIENTATION=+
MAMALYSTGQSVMTARTCSLQRQHALPTASVWKRVAAQQAVALRLPGSSAQLRRVRGGFTAAAGGGEDIGRDEEDSAASAASAGIDSHEIVSDISEDDELTDDDGWVSNEVLTGASGAATSFPKQDVDVTISATTRGSVNLDPTPPKPSALDRIPGGKTGRYAAFGIASFLVLTLAIGVVRAVKKFRSPRAKRVQQVNKNSHLVTTLSKFYPDNRDGFTSGEVRSLKSKTGYTEVEMYRKFLWYLLRERTFDPAAVQDTLHLKQALSLSDQQVADAIKERSERIYKKYGNVMLETEGMTKGGIERKATCRALFSKLLYLAESEELLPTLDQTARDVLVRDVFGATSNDLAQLRIVSLLEIDQDTVERLAGGDSPEWRDDDAPPSDAA